jgi:hypothetical protein
MRTLDLDPSMLRALKARQKRENKSLGQFVSELLAPALEAPTSSIMFAAVTSARGRRRTAQDTGF